MILQNGFRYLTLLSVALLVLASCGSANDVSTESAPATTSAVASDEEHSDEDDHDEDEDHDEESGDEHADEDHADESAEDHDKDEHGDEDHDDEHGDEDHDDEHGDEDHDDHDDDDHDDEDASGGLGAHVHGEAELFVAWSGSDMVVDLVSPAINIYGFEYEPETSEDKSLAAERNEALSGPGIIAFNAEAACELTGGVEPEAEYEGSHAEVTASWLYVCANPDEITELDLSNLFGEFPGMEDIDAQWASDDAQSAAELTPSSTVLRFE